MAAQNRSPVVSQQDANAHLSETDPHHSSATRVALYYLIVGLVWIGLTDTTLAYFGGITTSGFLVSTSKGVVFVALSTLLVFWLCRREYRKTSRAVDLLRAVVEGTTDAIFVKDREGRYLLVNAAGAKFIGRPVADVLGCDDRELFGTEEAEQLMSSDQAIMAGDRVVTMEDTLTSSTGITYTYQSTKAPYKDNTGAVVGLIGIGRDVTDRTRVDAALRETDARLREAQRIARLGSWSWEPPTNRVWWSDAEFELFGADPNSVVPSFEAFLALLHPDDRKTAIERVEAMVSGANEFANDVRVVRKDGTCLWIHSRALATRDAAGALVLVEGTDQDITAQRLAREAVLESEQRLQAAVEVAELGIIVIDYEQQTAELSPRAAEQFGMSTCARTTRSDLHSRFHSADREQLEQQMENALKPSGSGWFTLEHRIVRPDGDIRWLHVRKQVSFADGRPRGAVVVTADVTERRSAEARLREQEMLVREAAELAKVGGWGFDPVTLESDWTPEVARMYGLAPDLQLSMANALDYFNPSQRPALEDALAVAIRNGVPHDMELQLTTANGEEKWVRTICRPIVEAGQVVRVRGSLQDITDRKRTEAELRASEERYRLLFESNPHPMWVYDVHSLRFLAVNDAAVVAYGYSRDEFLAMTIREIRPAEEVSKLESAVARSERGFIKSTQWKHRRKDGSLFDVDVSSHDLPGGHAHTRLVLALDITDRKRAEAELQASERRLRLALEAAGAIAFVWDIPNNSVTRQYSTEPALPITGERVDTLEDVRIRIHPDDLAAFDTNLSACLAEGTDYHNEYRVVRTDGSIAYLEENGFLDRADDGSPLYLTGMVFDVTDRVLATEALRSSEERLREAAQVAGFGVFEHDHQTDVIYWSQRLREIYGMDQECTVDLTEFINIIHPNDRDAIVAAIRRAHDPEGDGRFDVEHQIIRPNDGQVRWLAAQSHTSFTGRGRDRRPYRTVGATMDITEARLAAEALQLSEARYRQLVDILPTAIIVHAEDKILYTNPAFQRLMGAATMDGLLGKSPTDFLHASSKDLFNRRKEEMERTNASLPGCEIMGWRCDGRPVPMFVVESPIDGYGRPATLVALSDLTERERSAALLRSVLDSVGDAILTIDIEGKVTSANRATERLFGFAETDLLGENVSVLIPQTDSRREVSAEQQHLFTGLLLSVGVSREEEGRRKDGTTFRAELTISQFLRNGEQEFTVVLRDITARRQLEEQFRQAQKMEAVGQLAGGVAHDFNNLLTVINGYTHLLLDGLAANDPARGALSAVLDAGDRAARLTQQLLAFSRRSVTEPQLLDLNELVSESANLLRRLIGENIDLQVILYPVPVQVMLDPGQLEQVLMNLAVNARDAMPTGGRLTIEIGTLELNSDVGLSIAELPPGRYASLQVTDTGCGIDDDVKDKIFEPFFTTKGVGRGTGLGLAVVHGVVKQSGGSIMVESKVGETRFNVLLPTAHDATESTSSRGKVGASPGFETVLVVEDEDAVRKLVRFALEGRGYKVLTASNGEEALELLKGDSLQVDLLVTDVIMPGISGPELAEISRMTRPELRVIYMSGYTDDALGPHGLQGTVDQFIQKPFTPQGLARSVRAVLDQPQ